jgi:hypothetical protein
MTLEKEIEKLLVKEVKKLGGFCWKFVSPGIVGVPDRLALLAKNKVAFIEVKKEGETLRPIQRKRKKQLENLGFKVYVLDSKEQVKEIIDELQSL